MVLCTCSNIGDFTHLLIKTLQFPNRIHEDQYEKIVEIIVDCVYFSGNFSLYTLILLRIHSLFDVNRFIIYCIVGFMAISVIYSGFYCYVEYLQYKYWIKIIQYVTFPLAINDFIINLTILVIFVTKMRDTVKSIDSSLSKDAERNVNLLVNVTVKHCILFGTAIILNQFYFVAVLFEGVTHDPEDVIMNYTLPYSLRSMENCGNAVVLWLVLRIGYEHYICLCKCCHLCAMKCCVKNIKPSVANPYYEL